MKVLASSVLEVEHARPQAGGPRGAGSLHHRLEAIRPVGQAGDDRRHADPDVDPGRDQLLDRTQPLPRMRGAGLSAAPDVVINSGDAEGDVQVGAPCKVGQHVEVAHDHGSARDHRRGVGEVAQRDKTQPEARSRGRSKRRSGARSPCTD
jgi:hypothetical protein